jgi:hypothetical protein
MAPSTPMSVKGRALFVGLAGPAIQAIGIVWTIAHLLISHIHEPLSPRHIIFDAPFLVIFVGFLVSIVCLPVALEVMQTSPEEVEIPVFEPALDGAGQLELQPRTSEAK